MFGSSSGTRAGHKPRRAAVLGACSALLLGLLALVVPNAAQANHPEASLPGSEFEIDVNANLKVDDPPPSIDWGGIPQGTQPGQEIRGTDLPSGQTDNSYKGGMKEDTVCPAAETGSIPNNKSDLLTFHGVTQEADPGFFNFAWSRVSDPSGTTLMDFEFNQSTTHCATGPNVVRTAGDLLVEYAIDQGGAQAEISGRTWTGTAWGPSIDLDDGTACGGGPCAVGTINTTVIPAAESDGLGLKQPRTFGEAQLDLRFLQQDPDECLSFGAMMVKSRSSDAFNSALKDFILPLEVNLTNCGSVIIRKNTLPDEDPASTSFDYTSDILTDPPESTSFALMDDESHTFNNVVQGDYFVNEEAPPAGWTFVGVDCSASTGVTVDTSAAPNITFTIDDADDVVDCTYTNQAQASLHVVKVAERDGVDFDFTSGTLTPAAFTLQNGDTQDFNDLAPGGYDVAETVPDGWNLDSATCDNGDDPAAITLVAGDDVTCTFDNSIERGALSIHKSAKHAADPSGVIDHAGVTFTVTNATNGTDVEVATDADGNACVEDLPVSFLDGDYTITETLPAGYTNADLEQDYTVLETDCAGAVVASFVNTPLTDVTVTIAVNSQVPGGTASIVVCTPDGPGGTTDAVTGDGTFVDSNLNLEPGTYTYDCEVTVDP